MKITNTSVKNIEPPETGYRIVYDDRLQGFGLRVTASGVRSYIAEDRVNGKTRRVTLGRHGTITADQARADAKNKLAAMSGGTDPAVERARLKAEAVTLAEAVEAYLRNRRTRSGLPLKDRTKSDIRYHLKTNFSDWADKPVVKISREKIQGDIPLYASDRPHRRISPCACCRES